MESRVSARLAGERVSRENRCRYISPESKWRCEEVQVQVEVQVEVERRQEKWMQHYSSV